MKPHIEIVSKPISLADVRIAEKEFDLRFPADYIEFLVTHNGGIPFPSAFFGKPRVRRAMGMRSFFSVGGGKFQNIKTYLRLPRIPAGLIPIGDDSGGNLLLLGQSKSRWSGVYFWELEMSALSRRGMRDLEREHHALKKVAPNFTSFLSSFAALRSGTKRTIAPVTYRLVRASALPDTFKNPKVIEELLLDGADPNASVEGGGETALHNACCYGTAKVVSLMLRFGAEVNAVADNGQTPLHMAIMCGRFRLVPTLLAAGASLQMKNNMGDSPLDMVTDSSYRKTLRKLARQATKNTQTQTRRRS